MSEQLTRTVVMLGDRFQATSGGRTRAYLERARILADAGTTSHILTFNVRQDYASIFDTWRQRLRLDDHVHFHNLWESYAGESLSSSLAPAGPFVPGDGDYRYVERLNAYKYFESGKRRRIHTLNEDGTLRHTNYYDENLVKLRRDRHGADGLVFLRTTFVPTSDLGDEDEPDVAKLEYLTPGGRTYLTRAPQGEEFDVTVVDEHGVVTGQFPDEHHFRSHWVASFAEEDSEAIFIVDARGLDPLVLDNPFRPIQRSVAAVHTGHLGYPGDDPHTVEPYNHGAFARAKEFGAVVVLTKHQKEDVEVHYGVLPNLAVIPHSIAPSVHTWPRLRRQDVVAITRFAEVKQVDQLIRAFASVRARVPRARLHLWGTGPEEMTCRALVEELGLEHSVLFRGHTSRVPTALREARVSASTSRKEGFSLAMMESLAAGTPFVTYDCRYGPRELIESGVNGSLVKQGDIDGMADALVNTLNLPRAQWKVMSRSAKASVKTLSATALRQRWFEVFDQLV